MDIHEIVFFCYISFAALGVVGPLAATFWFFDKLDREEKEFNKEIREIERGGRKNG